MDSPKTNGGTGGAPLDSTSGAVPQSGHQEVRSASAEERSASRPSTLRPPEWEKPKPARARASNAPPPLARRKDRRAEEATLRARLAVSGGGEEAREVSVELSRWLAAHERDLDEAVLLALRSLGQEEDDVLRREVASWLESLGEPSRAAAELRITAVREKDPASAAALHVRIGVLEARAGNATGAKAAFAEAERHFPEDALARELRATLAGWAPKLMTSPEAARAYAAAATRRALAGAKEAAREDFLRAFEADPSNEDAASGLSTMLAAGGRSQAADEVWRMHAESLEPAEARLIHARRRAQATAAGDVPRALAAALDEELDAVREGPGAALFDDVLLRAGLLEALAVRLQMRAESSKNDLARAHLWEELARLYAGPLANPSRSANAHLAALAADPGHKEALVALRAYATSSRDSAPLVEALIRAISSKDDGSGDRDPRNAGRLACARLLGSVAEEQLGESGVAAWALERVCAWAKGDAAAEAALERNASRAAALEAELVQARGQYEKHGDSDQGTEALRGMALLLRGLPGAGEELLCVLSELSRRVPGEPRFGVEATRVAFRLGDEKAILALATQRLANAASASENVEARGALATVALGHGDLAAANDATRALLDEAPGHRMAVSMAWLNAALAGDRTTRARALLEVAGACAKPLRAALDGVAADALALTQNPEAARKATEDGLEVEPQSARCASVHALLLASIGDPRSAASAERAAGAIIPRRVWCAAVAAAHEAAGDVDQAAAFTQRMVALAPGDIASIALLLERGMRAKNAAHLADALDFVLAQPLPAESLVDLVARALRALAALEPKLAVPLARRALLSFGARHAGLRAAMMHVADRAKDALFASSLIERWIASGATSAERCALFGALAERRAQAGDADGEARALARAVRQGVDLSEAAERILFLTDQTLGPDAELAWLEARAELLTAKGTPLEAACAWRDLGGARWDMAADRAGALRAWTTAASKGPPRGYATLAMDLARFESPEFALDCLSDMIEREPDRARSGVIAGEAARAALSLGANGRAFELAQLALQRNPTLAGALEIAERGSLEGDRASLMSDLYDMVARKALGRFGRRAAHYRGARFFEQMGDAQLALKHAAEAFSAVPSEGCTLVLLARAADRAQARPIAVRAVEQVAELAATRGARAAWLLRAAGLAGSGEEGARQRFDVLLRAVSLAPDPSTLALLADAAHTLLTLLPEERDVAQLRLARAMGALTKKCDGPEGARVALAFAELGLELFDDTEAALRAFERALGADGDIEEFGKLLPRAQLLATAEGVADWLVRALAIAEKPYANVGPPALKVVARIAELSGDSAIWARALTLAVERDQDEDPLVCDADLAIEVQSDAALRARFDKKIDPERFVGAWRGRARVAMTEGRFDDAIVALERAVTRVDAETRPELLTELRLAREGAGQREKIAESARIVAEDDELPLATRADRWTEVAGAREQGGDLPGAVLALKAAAEVDPEDGRRWVALERVAELAGEGPERIIALREIAARMPGEQAVLPLKRLARALEELDRNEEAEATWLQIWEIADDEEVNHAIEALVVARADYVDLADHLARRAERIALSCRPGSSEDDEQSRSSAKDALSAVRLRRAAILEQRLGRGSDAGLELERLLVELPDNESALSYLADLRERLGEAAAAVPLWRRAAALARDSGRRSELEIRTARAAAAAGRFGEAIAQIRVVLASRPGDVEVLELCVEFARAKDDPREIGDALDDLATASSAGAAERSDMVIEAAQCAARASNAVVALERAQRAARITPDRAKAQLFARGLEYRLRGSGAPDEARQTIESLGRIRGKLDIEDTALLTFLLAEALDTVQGGGAGMRKLSEGYAELGASPLLAVAMAERHVAQWNFAAAVPLFDAAIKGNLMGLRRRGQVALAAADAALRAERTVDALRFLKEATADPDTRNAALRKSAHIAATGGDVPRSREVLIELARGMEGEERARTLAQLARALFMSTEAAYRSEALQAFTDAIASAPPNSVLETQLRSELDELRRRQSIRPPPGPAEADDTAGTEGDALIEAGADVSVADLEGAVARASDAPSRAAARLSLAGVRLDRGEAAMGEQLLWDALGDGSSTAGETLAGLLEVAQGRSAELVKVRRSLVDMTPGDLSRIESLAAAALADHNTIYARALEHVVRSFDPGAGPLPPPPLAVQNEQPGMLSLLTSHSHEAAGQAIALAWEGAGTTFTKSAASYAITGLERVIPGSSSSLARLYEVSLRLLEPPPIPLFVRRAAGSLTFNVALLAPPSAILSGEAREDTSDLRWVLGQALSASLPHNALVIGLPESEGRVMWSALLGAFGPPELGKKLDQASARMAETFWELLPARTQRKLKELCETARETTFEQITSLSRQSGRAVGLFLTGDFGYAARAVVAEDGLAGGDLGSLTDPGGLARYCAASPALTDLLRLAVRPEYADARWHPIPPASQRSSGLSHSRFRIL